MNKTFNKINRWSIIISIIASITALVFSSFSLYFAKKATDEPKITIKNFKAIPGKPIDDLASPNFKRLSGFDPTSKSFITEDKIQNLLLIKNSGSIVAMPRGDIPSTQIQVNVQEPYRVYSIGIDELTYDAWNWKSYGEKYKIQICDIQIKRSLPVDTKLAITLLYYYPYQYEKKHKKIHPDSVLKKYFNVSAWSPQSLHHPPCYWRKERSRHEVF